MDAAMESPREHTVRFLDRLLAPEAQFIEIRTVVTDAKNVTQWFFQTATDAIRYIDSVHGKANVYISACPRSRQEGTRQAVTVVTCAWADLDFHLIDSNR